MPGGWGQPEPGAALGSDIGTLHGVVGTWAGCGYCTDHRFDFLFKWVLTLLALRLIWLGEERLLGLG